ncbi:HAD family phosphatase [Brevibacterium ammoniilyticum]|uniref:HAD family phosphatase n=1 Tax=Brevibacterium ammoniilyticum TaxID=1046555 RepID=A0ABP9U3I2_9MICO
MSDAPTTVVFDLGQVLIGWDQTGPLSDRMSREEWKEFAQASDFASLNVSADNGSTIAEVVARAAATDPAYGEIVAAYYENFPRSLTGPIPGMAEIVAELKDAGVRLLGLSNWSAETIHHAPVVAPAIAELEDIVVSGREKLIKPDPAIFALLLDRFGLDPGRTVFVDDLPVNVEAARELGLIGIVFTGAEDLRAELDRLGVIPA